MNVFGFIRLAFLSLSFAAAIAVQAEDRPPNIVLLIGDDHGFPYFGFMGDENVITPSMDALAEGGVTFSIAHASAPYCRPSLRTLITGLHPVQYAQRKNVILEERKQQSEAYSKMSKDEQFVWSEAEQGKILREFETLPKVLGEVGYASWQGGKWWENSYKNGYFTEGMTKGWEPETFDRKNSNMFLEMMGGEGTELGRTTMEPVLDFIERHQNQPFFIWYGPQLPHTPLDAPYQFRKYYESKDLSESAGDYYSNITWWDDGVGKLLDHIESLGILDNTLFIYLSDNGWEQEADVEYRRDIPDYALDPLYATGGMVGKGSLYDLSFRSPMIFYWRGHLDSSFDESSLVRAEDLYPTILDFAGAETTEEELPGYSLRPLLEGEQLENPRTEIVGFNDRQRVSNMNGLGSEIGEEVSGYYVRTNRWHYIRRNSGERELYDASQDIYAENNLIEKYKKLISGFDQKIESWKESIGMDEWVLMD